MKVNVAAVIAALVLGTAPISTAMAFDGRALWQPRSVYDVEATGSLGGYEDGRSLACPMSSAAEGNANQQTRPVKQYGQTSGGNRC